MTDQLHMQHSDDEEEDLERLRLDALKTIPNKAEVISQVPPYDHSSSRPAYKVVQPQTSTIIHNQNNTYYHPIPQSNRNLPIATRPLSNHFNNYDVRQNFDRMDVNEPYVPQNILNPRINDELMITTKSWTAKSTIQVGSNYIPYAPSYKSTENMIGVSNVQLSPRSMAFVAENNDILMRRKCEKPNYESNYTSSVCASPNYSPHSPGNRLSPNYRSFNERWSRSPTPKSKSRSPVFRHRQHSSYVNRRPSPRISLIRSPASRRKTLSKSPSRVAHRSPSLSPRQRYKSKSPVKTFKRERSRSSLRYKSPRRTSRSPNKFDRHGRSTSKSPLPNTTTGRRSPQPYLRQHNYRPRGNSRSPDGFRGPNFKEINNKHYTRKSRSPPPPPSSANQPTNNHRKSPSRINRSQSRSPPVRRYHQRFSRKDYNNMKFNRRNSPFDYNSTKRRNDNNNAEGNNTKNRSRKRSRSPAIGNSRKRYSKANTPERSRLDDNRSRKFDRGIRDRQDDNNGRKDKQEGRGRNFERKNQTDERTSTDRKIERKHSKEEETRKNDRVINKTEKDNKTENSGHDNGANKSAERSELNKASDKEKQQQQEEKVEKRDKNDDDRDKNDKNEDDSSNEDDSNDDGIDLFASDESESENEGRFKLNSNKNGRDTQVSTVSFTKLSKASTPVVKDLQEITTSTVTGRDKSSKNDRDRGRGRDRDHDRDRSKSKRESNFDYQRRDERFKKSLDKGRSRRSGSNNSERRRNNKTNKNDSQNSQSRRDPPEKSKIEKKSEDKPTFKSTFTVVENKGSLDNDVKPASETGSPSASPKLSSISRLVGGSSSVSSGKKPVHLRLGAMTNTFKASKKPSNWASSASSTSEKV